MIIYRLEHREFGFGPYVYEEYSQYPKQLIPTRLLMGEKHNSSGYHQVPWVPNRDTVCGCESLDHLMYWFDGFLKTFLDNEFCIRMYKTEKFALTNNQVLFEKSDATVVGIEESLPALYTFNGELQEFR